MAKRAAVVAIVGIAALAALWIASARIGGYAYAIDNVHWSGSPLPPCFANGSQCGGHALGTDEVGRDLAARLVAGGRVSLSASLLALILELLLAGALSLASRAATPLRFAIDCVVEALSSYAVWPLLVLVAIVLEVRHVSEGRLALLDALAALLLACALVRRMNCGVALPPIATLIAREWAAMLMLLATIDFFGLGVQPPLASWGNLLSNAQANLQVAWWAAVFPALCLVGAALAMEIGGRAISGS